MRIAPWIPILQSTQQKGHTLQARTTSGDICLPVELFTAVPTCAVSCIQTFILNNYGDHTCQVTGDLSSLCRTASVSGLTIGEGSLQCVITSCPGADVNSQSGYTVCEDVPGALPNLAKTITATITAVDTLVSSTDYLPTASSMVVTAATSSDSTITTEQSVQPNPTMASPTPPPSPSPSTDATSASTVFSSSETTTTIASSATTPVTNDSQTTDTSGAASRTSTATNSATAAAATEGGHMQKTGLSKAAIAGIASGSIIVVGILLGYLAYLILARKRERRKRQNQRLWSLYSPKTMKDDVAGYTAPEMTGTIQSIPYPNASEEFFSSGTRQGQRRSFWRNDSASLTNIGMAVAPSTRVSPEVTKGPTSQPGAIARPALALVNNSRIKEVPAAESRWSVATSFDEDLEAQNQDVLILRSPKTGYSSRSFSSYGVEKPAPLRLSKVRPRAESPPDAKIPLTPVYDNGNFEPMIRQVFDEDSAPAVSFRQTKDQPPLNFSRRQPSSARVSEENGRPFWSQNRRPSERFPVKPRVNGRKPSQVSNQSASVYTEIEEDDTPEKEEDKQLHMTPPAPATDSSDRSPISDLRYPEIPRPAALAKQATKPHSPRAAATIRRVDSLSHSVPTMAAEFRRRYNSSSSELESQSSASPVFPMPPMQQRGETMRQAQMEIARQISNAYRAASTSTTATLPQTTFPPRTSSSRPGRVPSISQPGMMYQQIQRLSTGRPLPHKLQDRTYRPPGMPQRSMSRAQRRSGDLYFKVN